VSVPGDVAKRGVSWSFDVSVVVTGLLLAVLGIAQLVAHVDVWWTVALLVGAPVCAVMSRFPLLLDRSTGGIEVGFESAVLIFLACSHGGEGALGVWALGQVLSQGTTTKRVDVRLFNVGLGVLAGWGALRVMDAVGGLATTEPRELAAVALGCATFFLVDYVASAISIALEEGTSVTRELAQSTGLAALGVFVAIDSLGYLGAIVVLNLPTWSAYLLAVPLLTILVASRALSRGFEHRRRLEALFDAAAEAQVVPSREALQELVRRSAQAAIANNRGELRDAPPGERQIGARVRAGSEELWIVAPVEPRSRSSAEGDRRALETLSALAEEAFARLALTEELAHLARHDALTALPNRTLFLDRVDEAVLRASRGDSLLAVLFLDLDGFKSVNDRFGHAAGDELLKIVGQRLVACVRASDSVARLGGDEFAVLVEGVENLDGLHALCERLLRTLREEIPVMGHGVVVGTSIGVAVVDPHSDAASLMRDADMAMYRAKALGKDRFYVYQQSLREESIRELELIDALRHGIQDELVVYYQPVVDLRTGRIGAVEALVRWQRSDTLVPPDVFIGVAERSGLIGRVGERVLAQVVADAPALQSAAGLPLTLGVNVSAPQLRDPRFVDQVRSAVAAIGDSKLVLEMTETLVVSDDSLTGHALNTLKAIGAKLAIDDFGVGFSSIGYLQHLPVDIVKIDRSFTADVDTSPRAAAIVESIQVMASALNLQVVAEGIERGSQNAVLRDIGIPIGQGYLFGRPMSKEETLQVLRAGLSADVRALWDVRASA
jgi:diguanylate cyclase (GGDEF)-like protein